MAQQVINIGASPNDATGDTIRSSFNKANQNFTELYSGAGSPAEFTTGDVKLTLKTVADAGWVMMLDQTIGDATSGATYANANAQALYTLLWTNIPDTWCPVTGGRGASAAADWGAHKPLKLPVTLGRALAAAGSGSGLTARVPGEARGAENVGVPLPQHNHGLTDPSHTHGFSGNSLNISAGSMAVDPGSSNNVGLWGGALGVTAGAATGLSVQNAGTAGATMSVLQPTSFLNVMIKL